MKLRYWSTSIGLHNAISLLHYIFELDSDILYDSVQILIEGIIETTQIKDKEWLFANVYTFEDLLVKAELPVEVFLKRYFLWYSQEEGLKRAIYELNSEYQKDQTVCPSFLSLDNHANILIRIKSGNWKSWGVYSLFDFYSQSIIPRILFEKYFLSNEIRDLFGEATEQMMN